MNTNAKTPVDVLAVWARLLALAESVAESAETEAIADPAERLVADANRARKALIELFDAADYALTRRDEAGNYSETASFNLRTALINCGVEW